MKVNIEETVLDWVRWRGREGGVSVFPPYVSINHDQHCYLVKRRANEASQSNQEMARVEKGLAPQM